MNKIRKSLSRKITAPLAALLLLGAASGATALLTPTQAFAAQESAVPTQVQPKLCICIIFGHVEICACTVQH
jgi:hypothetical protein